MIIFDRAVGSVTSFAPAAMDRPLGPRQPPDKRHAAYEDIFGRPGASHHHQPHYLHPHRPIPRVTSLHPARHPPRLALALSPPPADDDSELPWARNDSPASDPVCPSLFSRQPPHSLPALSSPRHLSLGPILRRQRPAPSPSPQILRVLCLGAQTLCPAP